MKLPLNGCIYNLTVGRVLNTKINLGQLLSGATLKVRLCSHSSMLLKWTIWTPPIDAHFKKFAVCLWEGLIHKWKHTLLAPLSISYAGKQLMVL